MTLVWPDGKCCASTCVPRAVSVSMTASDRSSRCESAQHWTQVAVQLDDTEVIVQAAQELQAWQELARFPRSEFAGTRWPCDWVR